MDERLRMYLNAEDAWNDALERMRRENVRFLDAQFTDILGKLHHVTLSTKQLNEDTIKHGIPKLDGSSIRGFTEIHESDMLLVPDPFTFAILPWSLDSMKTARVLCDVYLGYGMGRFERDPRAVAQRAEEELKMMDFDRSYWGAEVEFFVFDRISWDVLVPSMKQSYHIDSKEAPWSSCLGYPIRFKEGYQIAPPQDTLMEFRNECSRILIDYFGIEVEAHHHETAATGQCEINIRYDTLTAMADKVITLKYVVKNVAYRMGMVATMMPKPIFMDNASGMHVHCSIWKDGENVFYDANDEYAELSQIGRYFVGGLLEHSRALAAIVAPTTNSYKRLVPGYEAPVFIAWSKANRSANIRIPVYHRGKENSHSKRIEFRTPDPSCNPYLCFSAILMAGLDGVRKKIDCGDPIDEDIYTMSPERRALYNIKQLPGSLKEAVECLMSDNDFLRPVFSKSLIDKLIELELKQHIEVAIRPHPYEFYLYFDI